MRGKNRIINYVQTDKFCVYGLLCPLTLSVKYIGCTQHLEIRIRQHFITNNQDNLKNRPKNDWILSLRNQDMRPLVMIIKEFNNKLEALQFEQETINTHSHKLFNKYHTK